MTAERRLMIPPEERAKALPLRAGTTPRKLAPVRRDARDHGAAALDAACAEFGVSNARLAERFTESPDPKAADRVGAEMRSGKLVVTAGEAIALAPTTVAIAHAIDMALDRLCREAIASSDVDEAAREEWRRVHYALVAARSRIPRNK